MTKEQARRWLVKRGYRVSVVMVNPCVYTAHKYGSPMLAGGTLNGLVRMVKQR